MAEWFPGLPLCDQGPRASPAEKQHSQLDSAHAGSSLTQRPPSGLHGTARAAPAREGPRSSPRDTWHFLPRNSPHDLSKVLPEDTPGRALGQCVRQTRPYDIPSNHSPSEYKEGLNVWFQFISIKPFRHHRHHRNENCYMRKALPPTWETRGQTGRQRGGSGTGLSHRPRCTDQVHSTFKVLSGQDFGTKASQQTNKALGPIGCKEGRNLGQADTQGPAWLRH